MHCPECGANLPEDALYCGMCGKRLEEDPAFSARARIPDGLTGPLPTLTEEELSELLNTEKETAAPPDESSDSLDQGESAEVGRGEEFGRKGVSFEGIYADASNSVEDSVLEATNVLGAAGALGAANAGAANAVAGAADARTGAANARTEAANGHTGAVNSHSGDTNAHDGAANTRAGAEKAHAQVANAHAGAFGAAKAFAQAEESNAEKAGASGAASKRKGVSGSAGSRPEMPGGGDGPLDEAQEVDILREKEKAWKRTLYISLIAIAVTAALVFLTIRTLGGGNSSPGGGEVPAVTSPTPGTESKDDSSIGTTSEDSGTTKSGESSGMTDSGTSSGTTESGEPSGKTDSGTSSEKSGKTDSGTSSGNSGATDKDASKASGDESGETTSESSGTQSDASGETHSGRRRVTATPTPTLLPTHSPTPRPTATPTPVPKTDVDFIREALGDRNAVLLYVSDANSAWHTEITVRNDATITGSYREAVVEISGDHELLVKNCTFTGHLYDCKKLRNGVYSMNIKVRLNGSEGDSHLEGNTRYVTTHPTGLNSDDGILLYLPGTSVEGLNEGLLGWLRRARGSDVVGTLPGYALLDVNTGYGFGEYGK